MTALVTYNRQASLMVYAASNGTAFESGVKSVMDEADFRSKLAALADKYGCQIIRAGVDRYELVRVQEAI